MVTKSEKNQKLTKPADCLQKYTFTAIMKQETSYLMSNQVQNIREESNILNCESFT